MRIESEDLTLAVRGRALVDGVSLAIGPGEALALVGPNGSGKSTLLRLLAGLARPTGGRVLLDGEPLARLGRRQIARRIAIVAQQAETAQRISARAVVALGRTPWLSTLRPWGPADDRAVDRALATVEMTAFAGRDWASLSGGERQRLHIARALAQEPGLLLLDEPTNHLDIHHQLAILGFVRALSVTTVVALHDLNHAMAFDRVAVLSSGRLAACGPPAQTLTPATLSPIFGVSARRIADTASRFPMLEFRLPRCRS